MPEALPLAGKVAIITGAAGGIGAATTALFASQGAAVLATDVTEPEVRGGGDSVKFLHHDASAMA